MKHGSKSGLKEQRRVAKKFPITNKSTVHKYSGEVSLDGKRKKKPSY